MPKKNLTDLGCKETVKATPPSKTPEYRAWIQMRYRCENPNHREYRHYGGRGITVCAEWSTSFAAFLAHIGPRPSIGHSLDRIDNSRGYSPSNCKWATRDEQANNRRNNREITCCEETLTLAEWSRRVGVPAHTILTRLDRLNWPVERALNTPSRPKARQLTESEALELRQLRQDGGWSIADIQVRFKCSRSTVFNYLRVA